LRAKAQRTQRNQERAQEQLTMSAEPTSKIQKITKSIEVLLKTVLTGFASTQLQALLGRRLLAKAKQDPPNLDGEEQETLVNAPSHALAAAGTVARQKDEWRDESKETPEGGLATILVVDPNPLTREVMRRALRSEGYQVLEAENGQSALRIMANGVPNLVLQNPALPDMEGSGLIQWLRALPGGMAVPVLAIAEDPALLAKMRASQVGFAGFLGKPFLPSRLLQTVCFYFPYRSSGSTVPPHLLPQRPAVSGATHGVPSTRSLVGRRILLVEDNVAQRQLLVARLLELGMDVTTADNGREALEQARTGLPDAIVCDTLMPGLDGFELCLAIRKNARLAGIPVVLRFAGIVAEVDTELAKEFGVTAMVSRGTDFGEVMETLVTCLREKPAGPPPVPALPPVVGPVSRAGLDVPLGSRHLPG
jgi:CheY-like chemotaxis protein